MFKTEELTETHVCMLCVGDIFTFKPEVKYPAWYVVYHIDRFTVFYRESITEKSYQYSKFKHKIVFKKQI